MAEELWLATIACEESPEVRAMLITGEGRFFGAGGDLGSFAGAGPAIGEQLAKMTYFIHGAFSSAGDEYETQMEREARAISPPPKVLRARRHRRFPREAPTELLEPGERQMAVTTPKKQILVDGRRMAYVESGQGVPLLFLHGNPTSSYLWRNVMRPLDGIGRLVAPDLIGMGDSEKLSPAGPDTYRFATHSHYLDGFIEQIIPSPEKAVLIVHDWGSALGFDWANRHRDRAAAIVYMEGLVRPIASWDEWNKAATPVFQGFRSDKGEDMVLNRNIFVERVLPGSILRKLTEEEMTEYRRPFLDPADRWPTLTWPRELPIAGEPADVVTRIERYSQWLASSQIPKLFVNAEPGAMLTGAVREFCRTWPNQTEVTVAGSHFIQEDSGEEIGQAIRAWLETLRNAR
jgi:haloalkane dehalogenase